VEAAECVVSRRDLGVGNFSAKPPVQRTRADQVVGGDRSLVEHQNAIGAANRRQTMRDDERSAAASQPGKRVEDGALRHGIELRGRLVEDEDRCILQKGARDAETLALTSGHAGA